MPSYEKTLKDIAFLPAAAAAQVTNPTGWRTAIRLILLCNTDGTDREVTFHKVADGGTAADANMFRDAYTVPAGETREIEYPAPGYILEEDGDMFQAFASLADKVTISVFGKQWLKRSEPTEG